MKTQIVLATGNAGKLNEIRKMLVNTLIEIVPQSEYNVQEAVEDRPTFIENALIKARNASLYCKMPAIADDSGLEVDAINGEPGVVSSRYSGPNANDQQNIHKLLEKMKPYKSGDRKCRFRCVMVYLNHANDPSPLIAEGTLEGVVHHCQQGEYGFGYDPVVWLPQKQCTMAELPTIDKNKISHRGLALRSLINQLNSKVGSDVE